jgi:hypothetical protein
MFIGGKNTYSVPRLYIAQRVQGCSMMVSHGYVRYCTGESRKPLCQELKGFRNRLDVPLDIR